MEVVGDMALDKAIEHNKEKRKPYRGAKAVDTRCRNHGGSRHGIQCEYCLGNRTYKNKERERLAKEELKNNQ